MSWLFGRGEQTAFHDRTWKRAEMAGWDERWGRLSPAARRVFVEELKAPPPGSTLQCVSTVRHLDESVCRELAAAGLIEVGALEKTAVVPESARGFAARLRTLRQCGLFEGEHHRSRLDRYVSQVFASYGLGEVVAQIAERATGLKRYCLPGDIVALFVPRRSWPDWVVASLDDSLAGPLLQAIEREGGQVSLSRLGELLPGNDPGAVRETLDRLVNHLALVEGLAPETLELRVGLLPVVREQRLARRQEPRDLETVEAVEVGPAGGIDVPDLSAVLLEVAVAAPRQKRDGSLFAKEQERFQGALEPLPGWWPAGEEQTSLPGRLEQALRRASWLGLARTVKVAGESRQLRLTPGGQSWLGQDREVQCALLFEQLRDPNLHGSADESFLGCAIVALPGQSGTDDPLRWGSALTDEQRQPLRESLYRLFSGLAIGRFHALEEFVQWASQESRNPLLLGRGPAEVLVRSSGRIVPALEEYLETTAQELVRTFVVGRLAALGCVQMGRDSRGRVVFARQPRLAAYFGKAEAGSGAQAEVSRVLVQPDFTVVVIGRDVGPAAALAPFAERERGRLGGGALTFRLSRESVLRGVAEGMAVEEMVERLRRYSGQGLPGNVEVQMRSWAGQLRRVTAEAVLLLRCPDAGTAGRVVSALGKKARLVSECVVSWSAEEGLSGGLRRRLREQGIVVEGERRQRKKER